MDVWWGGLLPSPEDYNKDPRIEQLADLKRQLDVANKVVASLTPRSAQKAAASGAIGGRALFHEEDDAANDTSDRKTEDESIAASSTTTTPSANPLLASFQLHGKTALVVGDHPEVVKTLSDSLASLGAGVAEGNLESATAGTWVKAVSRARSGEVTQVDAGEVVKSPPHSSRAKTASAMAQDRTGVDVAVVVGGVHVQRPTSH